MNERFKELAEQAGLYDEKTPEEVPGFTACFEKFAELIVKECVKLIRDKDYSHTSDPIFEASCDIENHFGVEE